MQYGGLVTEMFSNSEGVECAKFNSFRVGKYCLLHAPRLASRVIHIQSFQDLTHHSQNTPKNSKTMKIQCLTIFLLLVGVGLQAQTIVIEGTILDKTTKEPIGYAHIGLPSLGIGTTSSNNGTFKLSIPKNKVEEWFTISFMGYKTYKKKVKQLDVKSTILLEKDEINLAEIIVMEETLSLIHI